jgi:hypothetical protein
MCRRMTGTTEIVKPVFIFIIIIFAKDWTLFILRLLQTRSIMIIRCLFFCTFNSINCYTSCISCRMRSSLLADEI